MFSKSRDFLQAIGIKTCTQRHTDIVTKFLDSNQDDIAVLLSSLGNWDDDDFKRAEM